MTLYRYFDNSCTVFGHTGYVLLQAHTQHENNTISGSVYVSDQEYESKNSGIVKWMASYETTFWIYATGSQYQTNAILLAVPILKGHPIPGGCCLTCSLDIDPNLRITYNELRTSVSFSRASKYFDRTTQPDCDGSENPETLKLVYYIYYKYINENDYSEVSLFNMLYEMSTPDKIKTNGILLTKLSGTQSLSVDIETVFAQGVIYNVIVSDENGFQTAYVPASVYACNFTAPEGAKDNCQRKDSVTVLVVSILFAIIGMLMCFAGFKLFRLFVFVTSTILYWFIAFVLLCRYTNGEKISQESNFIVAFLVSLVGGGLTLLMYAFDKFFYLVFLKVCLVFGMSISAIIFYTPFGYFDIWSEDYRFILGFVSITIVFAMISLFTPKACVYLCSSLLGSYAITMVPNYFLRSNMQYIMMTVINRFIIPKYGDLYLRRPFERMEKILTGCWAGLLLFGFIIQYATTKDQDFHYSGKRLRHRVWNRFNQSVNLGRRNQRRLRRPVPSRQYQESPPPEESAPLLDNLETSEDHSTAGRYGGLGRTNVGITAQNHQSPTVEHRPLLHQSPLASAPPPPYHEYEQHQSASQELTQPPSYEDIGERQPLLQPNAHSNERFPTRIV